MLHDLKTTFLTVLGILSLVAVVMLSTATVIKHNYDTRIKACESMGISLKLCEIVWSRG
jgi:hypothetical protein